jgi:hypothetical protein
MKNRSPFITAALEELQQEAGQDVSAVDAVAELEAGPNAPPVTETKIESDTDAVAELMEKNSTLAAENDELSGECFDNDVQQIESTSDTVNTDLEEAVSAGAALEELAYICDLAVKSGQANHAAAAGYAMALEQISLRAGLSGSLAALEDGELAEKGPDGQVGAIGDAAKAKSKTILERLMAGIKKIIAWIVGVVRSIAQKFNGLTAKAEKAIGMINQIDGNAVIDDEAFIKSLRMVKNAGDANAQFRRYGEFATKTLYGFFNDSFLNALSATARKGEDDSLEVYVELSKILSGLRQHVFEYTKIPDAIANELKGKLTGNAQLEGGMTEPQIGGLQLYLAFSKPMDQGGVVKAGVAPAEVPLVEGGSIPVVEKKLATDMLELVKKWSADQNHLADRLAKIEGFAKVGESGTSVKMVELYLKTLTAIATVVVPQLLRVNIQNAASFIRYVEKSVEVSKAKPAQK